MYRLSSITSVRLNIFITDICEKYDYSRDYFRGILKVLKGSFHDACNIYGFLKYNPALTLRLLKIENDKDDVKHLYSQDEIDKILQRFISDKSFTCAFLTSCFTGMRTGEVFALTWEDIDLENGIINIRHNVYDKPKDKKGRWYIGTPKTLSGKRVVYISDTLKIALTNYKKKQQYYKRLFGRKYYTYHLEEVTNEYGKIVEYRIVQNAEDDLEVLNLVFTKIDGKYVGTDLTRKPFDIIHNELGIKKCRFYDLRGSYATKILNNGIEIRDVADLLGHKNIETTENYYISSTNNSKMMATNTFEKITHSEIIDKIIKYEI